jgi:single-strand DNA-binding protein
MASLNKVMLIGNLTRDPEVRYTAKGTAVADIGLAVNRFVPATETSDRREETTFIDVTLWGKQAELAKQYLSKGRSVFIEGRLQLETWQDKATGQNRSKLSVVAEGMQFLGGRQDGGAGGGGGEGGYGSGERSYGGPRGGESEGGYASAPSSGQAPRRPSPSSPPEAEDDDIPF